MPSAESSSARAPSTASNRPAIFTGRIEIDIASVSGGNIGAFGPTVDILNLPYIFKDDASAAKLINGWLGEELSKRAEKEFGLKFIAIIPSYGFRNLDNSKREIKVPADTKGLKFRVTKSPVSSVRRLAPVE